MTPAQRLLSALFDADDVVNVRVISDGGGGARNELILATEFGGIEYSNAFPCVGINPRETVKKLATIKNLAIDVDGAPLPEWAKERADIICSRGKNHHHLYFCFAPGVTRDEYKAFAARLIMATPGADAAVSDPERVLRLPGFAYNKKGISGEGYKITLLRKKNNRLPIAEKFAWLNSAQDFKYVDTKPAQQVSAATPVVAAPNTVAYLKNLYFKKEKLGSGDGRSRRLWFVGIDCHAWGIPLDDALKLATEINETFAPPETAQVVNHQIKSAYKYAKSDFGSIATRTADATAGTRNEETAKKKLREELHKFERAQKVRDLFSEWVYVHAAARFCDASTGFALTSKEQIEDYITARVGEAVSLRDLMARDALTRCDRMEFDPAVTDRMFERDGLKFFNAYTAPRTAAPRDLKFKKLAVKAFKEHVGLITTNEDEETNLLNYFAYCVQNKGKKVDWTPLLISDEGLGKSYFYKLFARIFGEHNCSSVAADNLLGGWTDFMAEKLFVVSHEVKMKETQGLEKLKTLISEDRVVINGKYSRMYDTKNCANFLLLSNEADALRLTLKSRRFFVIFSRAKPQAKEYYDALFDSMYAGAGWIEDYLLARDLSAFTPHGPAPKTEGLRILAMASRGDGVAWMDERAEAGEGAFKETLLTAAQVANDAAMSAPALAKYITQRAASAWLANSGFRPVVYRLGSGTRRGWFRGDEEAFQAELKKLKEKVGEINKK